MTIEIGGWERDAQDYRGKEQSIVYHATVGGQPRKLSRADLLRAIEMNLPEVGELVEPETPFPDNGTRSASLLGREGA
jgi:hypothetical protein